MVGHNIESVTVIGISCDGPMHRRVAAASAGRRVRVYDRPEIISAAMQAIQCRYAAAAPCAGVPVGELVLPADSFRGRLGRSAVLAMNTSSLPLAELVTIGRSRLTDRLCRDFTVHQDDLLVEKSAASAFLPDRCPCRGCWNNARSTPS